MTIRSYSWRPAITGWLDANEVRRNELREETFVPVSPLMPTFPALERRLGFRPRFVTVDTADYQAILGIVAAGLGIALVPRTVVEQADRDDIVAVPVAGRPIRRRVEVALPKYRTSAATDGRGSRRLGPAAAARLDPPEAWPTILALGSLTRSGGVPPPRWRQ